METPNSRTDIEEPKEKGLWKAMTTVLAIDRDQKQNPTRENKKKEDCLKGRKSNYGDRLEEGV